MFFKLLNYGLLLMMLSMNISNLNAAKNAEVAVDLTNFDKSSNPGDDFYKFVNGGWMKNNPIPAEESRWGAFNVLNFENQKKLKELFEGNANNKNLKKGTNEQRIGDFYASGMDVDKIEKDGITPLKPLFERIEKIKNNNDFQNEVAYFAKNQVFPIFYFYGSQDEKNSEMVIPNIYQGGISLPDRDYYTNDDDRSKNIRAEYLKHLKNMFILMGEKPEVAAKNADIIMSIETQLAKASMTRLEQRDPKATYNKMKLADLQKKTANFNWNSYFTNIGLKNPNEINVGQPKFFGEINSMMKTVSIDDWKIYLKWHLLHSVAPYLNSAFVDENFNFYGKVLTGAEKIQERWKRVLNTTSSALGEAVGEVYVSKYFPPEAKTRMLKLVANLRKALENRIKNLTWMTDVTKKKALEKLATIGVKIGYPDKWQDYSKLNISRDSYVMNVLRSNEFDFQVSLAKVNKPVDRGEWHMTPQTINAYYSPNMNEIVFPAAILQPPFFYLNADDAVNYGAIGVVIGHEMTHGFDDQGRQYDAKGNLSDWWTEADAKKFESQVQVLVDQFDQYTAVENEKVNGKLTLGENIADCGGLTIALEALKTATNKNISTPVLDGYTPLQRFFISYAQVWRQNIRTEELLRRLKEDVHSPGEFRVNGGVVNIPEFFDAFKVTPQNKLYVAPEKRAIIW